jgi:hypothetical protein
MARSRSKRKNRKNTNNKHQHQQSHGQAEQTLTGTGMNRIRKLWERGMNKDKNGSRTKHQEKPVCIGIKSRSRKGQR